MVATRELLRYQHSDPLDAKSSRIVPVPAEHQRPEVGLGLPVRSPEAAQARLKTVERLDRAAKVAPR